jgi:colicin import membrane protein
MAPKQATKSKPESEHSDASSSSDEETIEVQVQNAKARKKGNPALKERGKAIQSKGVETRKADGAASAREREVARLAKKNDKAERLAQIAEKEAAEKERAERLAQSHKDKKGKDKVSEEAHTDSKELNTRLARMEELLAAREAEASKSKKKAPPKKKATAVAVEASDSDEDAPPRQKAVKRSAKTELKRRVGAEEETIHGKSNVLNNKNKQKALDLERQQHMEALARNIMPGLYR